MTEDEILREISDEIVVMECPRIIEHSFSPEKLAAFLAKHLFMVLKE